MRMKYRDVPRHSLQASQSECFWHDKNTRNNDACVCTHMCEGTATQPDFLKDLCIFLEGEETQSNSDA